MLSDRTIGRRMGAHAAIGHAHSGRPRAVVTGAAGFIGSHLTEKLLHRGQSVLGIDSFTPFYAPAAKRANLREIAGDPGFELLAGDLNELDLHEVLRPGDVIFHLAGQPGVRTSWGDGFAGFSRNNVEATQRLLEAAVHRKVARVVFASSSSVYGDVPLPMSEDGPTSPVSPYGLTKLAAEQLALVYAKAFGLEVVPLRFFTVYGPRQRPDMAFHRFIESILAGRPVIVYGDGNQVRDFTYVGDVVEALLAAAERGEAGRPVNVGGGSAVSVRRAISILESLLRRRAAVEHRPVSAGDARATLADHARLESLGVQPRTDIEEGLRRQVEWRLRTYAKHRARGSASGLRNGERPTYVLYSHDTYGLGHLRRNTAIAHSILAGQTEARVVLITGSPVAARWPWPKGLKIVRLPPVTKVAAESYRPIDDRSMPGLIAERAGIICATLARARPQAFLVDHAPLGVKGELRLALEFARETLPETWTVLGMRDILDDPAEVRRVWDENDTLSWIEASYDRVLVYGSRELFDVGHAYGFGSRLLARTRYTGYVAKQRGVEPEADGNAAWRKDGPAGATRILVTGGGGGDAEPLFSAFLDAWPLIRSELRARALLVTGPLMSERARHQLEAAAGRTQDLDLLRSSSSMLSVISAADIVISMGGYNSVIEAVSARKRLIICPRERPRREQLIRTEIFAGLGLARCVRLDQTGAPGLAGAVVEAMREPAPPPGAWANVDLRGGERAAAELVRPIATPLGVAI